MKELYSHFFRTKEKKEREVEMAWFFSPEEEDALLRMRRDLHQHPELGWQEFRTSQVVFEALQGMGFSPRRIATTGVVVDIGEEGPMVALRADLDALPIQEDTALPFASATPGVMHACGHDVHTACLVAVARRFAKEPPKGGRVRLIFQPAEEVRGGASTLIQEGALDDPRPKAIFGAHIWSRLPPGSVGVVEGPMMGSVDRVTITLRGRGGHAAMPQDTTDCLLAGAYLVTHLQTFVTRRLDPLTPAVLTISEFHAGTAFNVIPEVATLVGTIRTLEQGAWAAIPRLLEEIIYPSAQTFGCKAEIDLERMLRPVINHPGPTRCLQELAREAVGSEGLRSFRTLGGEDFSAYLDEIPGCFFFVGAGAEDGAPHHNSRFCLKEEGFPLVVRLLEGCARQTLGQLAQASALMVQTPLR